MPACDGGDAVEHPPGNAQRVKEVAGCTPWNEANATARKTNKKKE